MSLLQQIGLGILALTILGLIVYGYVACKFFMDLRKDHEQHG